MSGLIKVVNWYERIAHAALGSSERAHYWAPVISAFFIPLLIGTIAFFSRLGKTKPSDLTDQQLLPSSKITLKSLIEVIWQGIFSTLESILGHHVEVFAPLLGSLFFFIFFSNLSGLIPGFSPATEQIFTSFALGLIVFMMFNFYGLKYQGLGYIKHLFGPVAALAPLMFVIEFVSLCVRPVSLSLRLTGNLYGDHMVFSAFLTLLDKLSLSFLPIPALMLIFGLLVAYLQSFIFMTLSSIYMKMSLH